MIGRGLRDAVGFLTRVPVHPGPELDPALPWFPLVGALVGGLAGAVRWAADPLGPLAATVLAVVAAVVVTGALHEDGVADLADALPAPSRARRLEILDDPAAGTFGVLALVCVMLLRVGLLAPLGVAAAARALIAAHAMGRAAPLALGRLLPSASDGLGRRATGSWSLPIVVSLVATFVFVGVLAGPAAPIVAAVLVAGLGSLLARRLGGMTGDGMGAAVVAGELGALIGAAAWR